MKKYFILLSALSCLVSASCSNPTVNNSSSPTDENQSTSNVEQSTSNVEQSTNSSTSDDKTDEKPLTDIVNYDKSIIDYFNNHDGLSQQSINSLNFVDEAVETLTSNEKQTVKQANKKLQKSNDTDSIEVNGLTLQKESYTSRYSNDSMFISNMINIKCEIIQLQSYIQPNEFRYLDYGQSYAIFTEYTDTSITYFETNMSNGKIMTNENGIPVSSSYFSLSYNEENDTYYYDSFSFFGNYLLTNISDLKTYAAIYQNMFNGSPASFQYINYNELEERYDESGNLRDFAQYDEDDAFLHKHMEHCMFYKGYENDENGYYNTHYKNLMESIIEKFSNYTPTEYDPMFLYQEYEKRPQVNPALYYLTCGYTKPIIGYYEYGTRPAVYASMQGLVFESKTTNYKLLVETEDLCVEMPLSFFIEDLTYEENSGIYDVSVKLGDEIIPIKMYSNSEIDFIGYAFDFMPELLKYYDKNENFITLLEYFTKDLTYIKGHKEEIDDFYINNITTSLFESEEEYLQFTNLFNEFMNEITLYY